MSLFRSAELRPFEGIVILPVLIKMIKDGFPGTA